MPNTAPEDPDFLRRSTRCLDDIQAALDDFDPDELEADHAAGVLKITFADGRHCVLNRQAAASQIWLAEGASAWHFAFDAERDGWFDTKARGELKAILGEVLTRKLGRTIDLGD
ncbi:MAG: iron donor protein CyaY [Planctomycetes bacterium]|nr:iron donor protein CyaY [Planctomycetota bacterium]